MSPASKTFFRSDRINGSNRPSRTRTTLTAHDMPPSGTSIDGKSPVEYLSPVEQQTVRDIAMPLIADPIDTVEAVLARTAAHLALEDQL